MLFRKKRWLCKEVEDMLLALHPVYDISVRMNVSGTPVSFPFRDNEGKLLADPYERGVESVTVDYMRGGCPVETFFVGKGIESDHIDFVRRRLDAYTSQFPKTSWTSNLKQLAAMREELRTAICNSMGVDFVREEGDDSPTIVVPFSLLSPETKRRICDVICSLDSDAVPVQLDFFLDVMNAEQICTTLDQLALYDAEKESEQDEEGSYEEM